MTKNSHKSPWQKLPLQHAEVYYCPIFLSQEQSLELCNQLTASVFWHQESLTLYGKTHLVPRLVAWYGDPEAVYRYSGVTHEPLPWLSVLQSLREDLEEATGCGFNSVLLNRYRDGSDSMGWHSDNEPELGSNPVIASISLGAERPFKFRRVSDHKQSFSQVLGNGSLLLMGKGSQEHWQHSVAKTKKPVGERINLTFRYIQPETSI
ncbi:MAG: alpha-ketoglutarate-dependent dioxygenase AlkB [Cellvibrionaceae bacterium]